MYLRGHPEAIATHPGNQNQETLSPEPSEEGEADEKKGTGWEKDGRRGKNIQLKKILPYINRSIFYGDTIVCFDKSI